MGALKPCPRAFCGGSAEVGGEDGFHWIQCQRCRWGLWAPRDPSPAQRAELVAQWNAQGNPLDTLPAFLRERARLALGNERWQLLDAAQLIEQQQHHLGVLGDILQQGAA